MRPILACLTFALMCAAASAQTDLPQRLQSGGLNLFFRHAITEGQDPYKVNPPNETLSSCATQRPLNETGRAQAREIGRRINDLGIPIGEVYASPVCRCEETARLAFGRVTTVDWLVARRGQGMPRLNQALRSVPSTGFFTKTPSGKNNVFVGHNITFSEQLVGPEFGRPHLEEGEALVIEPGDPPRVLGRVKFY
ncbi:MAG: hypothetical protein RL513_151 [Pseudomonadota bacterium]|jgi:hypothetical protein